MKTLKETIFFNTKSIKDTLKKTGMRKILSPAVFLFIITCLTLLSSCVVVAGHPRHHRHHREVIVVEHR